MAPLLAGDARPRPPAASARGRSLLDRRPGFRPMTWHDERRENWPRIVRKRLDVPGFQPKMTGSPPPGHCGCGSCRSLRCQMPSVRMDASGTEGTTNAIVSPMRR